MPSAKKASRWEETRKLYENEDHFYNKELRLGYYQRLQKLLLNNGIPFNKKSWYLEVGGGEYPFVNVLDSANCVALDPFWDPHFPTYKFSYVCSKIEDFKPIRKFDYAFILNVIDHVDDIDRSIKSLHTAMKKGGKVVIILNTYQQQALQRFFQHYNRYFDRPHPHHFTKDQFIKKMKRHGFKLILHEPLVEQIVEESDGESFTKKLTEIIKDPLLIIRILIIRLSVLLTRKPFRPAQLYILEA